MGERKPEPLSPLRKSITVPWSQEEAFRRFTEGIASWWPLRSHSVGQERAETVIFEGRLNGRIYERMRGGEESTWGTVTAWEPPQRVAFTWHPARQPETAQDIEVRFLPRGPGGKRTRVELTHTGWERLGPLARKARRGYPIGWSHVLRLYADRRWSPVVVGIEALLWALGPLQRRMRKRNETTAARREEAAEGK